MDWIKKSNLDEMQYAPYYMYAVSDEGSDAISRWKDDIYADFRGRMRWSVTNQYSEANHHPVAIVNDDKSRDVVRITALAGQTVTLSGDGCYNPDGDSLKYDWLFYKEPSSYKGSVVIK